MDTDCSGTLKKHNFSPCTLPQGYLYNFLFFSNSSVSVSLESIGTHETRGGGTVVCGHVRRKQFFYTPSLISSLPTDIEEQSVICLVAHISLDSIPPLHRLFKALALLFRRSFPAIGWMVRRFLKLGSLPRKIGSLSRFVIPSILKPQILPNYCSYACSNIALIPELLIPFQTYCSHSRTIPPIPELLLPFQNYCSHSRTIASITELLLPPFQLSL